MNGENLVPDCQNYTNPEEIGALKKYLKEGIKALSDRTELEVDNLQVANLDNNNLDVPLSSKILELDNPNSSLSGLETNDSKFLTKNSDIPLSSIVESLRTTNQSELSKTRLDLKEEKEISLDSSTTDLPGGLPASVLQTYIDTINPNLEINLQKESISIGRQPKDSSLNSSLLSLPKENLGDQVLSNEIKTISDNNILSLDSKKISLTNVLDDNNTVSTFSDTLLGVKELSQLEDSIISFENISPINSLVESLKKLEKIPEEIPLSDVRDNLIVNDKSVLETKVVGKLEELETKLSEKIIRNNSIKTTSLLSSEKINLSAESSMASSLENTLKNLQISKNNIKLETNLEVLSNPNSINSLPEIKLKKFGESNEPALDNQISDLPGKLTEVQLDESKKELNGTTASSLVELPQSREKLSVDQDSSLDQSKIYLQNSLRDEDLVSSKISLSPSPLDTQTLSDKSVDLSIQDNNLLSNTVIPLGTIPQDISSLPIKEIKLNSPKDSTLETKKVSIVDERDLSLSEIALRVGGVKKDPESLGNTLVSGISSKDSPLSKKIIQAPSGGENYEELMSYLGTKDPEVVDKYLMTVDELKKSGNWGQKVASYLGAILSKNSRFLSVVPEDDINLYKSVLLSGVLVNQPAIEVPGESKEINSLESNQTRVPDYKLPGVMSLGSSNLLRYAVENTVGKLVSGSTKQKLLDETLNLLIYYRDKGEETLKLNKWRLPGSDNLSIGGSNSVLGSALQASGSVVGSILSDPLINPVNRPNSDGSNPKDFGNKTYWTVNRDSDRELGTGTSDKGVYTFLNNYNKSDGKVPLGIATTLSDLCGVSNPTDTELGNVETFKSLLSSSKFITTSDKVTGSMYSPGKVMTLDSNHMWEVRFFPYIGTLNGNRSWLPSIAEINTINKRDHGINTNWSEWIPVTSFELQAKKMNQKTLGLYDGEISYPISMEFTNEFRMNLADDAYKSWKIYFERCAETSIYLSDIHDSSYYSKKSLDPSELTPIVQGNIKPGMYKNLCFRCLIYIMTPQMSTIRKFDFLLVLKDYPIEYQGDTDVSSPDLGVSFSIVGENPPEDVNVGSENLSTVTKTSLKKRTDLNDRVDYTTILTGGVNNTLKLL